jgi:nucleotidyltransferase substrate binding protein (TIGR01987 family)
VAEEDVRWKQRYESFRRSVENLQEALSTEQPNKLERQGIIKAFELCYELAWKTLQDYLAELGYEGITGPKPVIRQAFEAGLLQDGELWRAIHRARNESAHVYNEDTARDLERRIRRDYTPALATLRAKLAERYEQP